MKRTSFKKLIGGILGGSPQPLWHPAGQPYPRLLGLDVGAVTGRAGLYAIWHMGVRPQWLRVGAAADLGATMTALMQTPWVVTHESNAGIFVAWAFPPATEAPGMARYLAETLKPAFQSEPISSERTLDMSVASLPCPLPPGTRI